MSTPLQLSRVAASYGRMADEARRLARAGRVSDARWYGKIARSDFRTLCHLSGLQGPAAHRVADSFAA